MKSHLSPRELAEAIGLSESSVKRWADEGLIAVTRTAGGHRRIARADALRFIRRTGVDVVQPQVLGVGEAGIAPVGPGAAEAESEALFEALCRADRDHVLALVQSWFLAGEPLARIFDGPVAGALHRVGTLWRHGEEGIACEHRATDLCVQAVTKLHLALPPADEAAPVAVGAAPSGDPYLLPTLMAAAVVQDAGMRPVNLGPQTPLSVLRRALREHRAVLGWLSVSTDEGAESVRGGLVAMAQALRRIGTEVLVGGRSARSLHGLRGPGVTFGERMAEMAAFARGLVAGKEPGARQGRELPPACRK